MPSRPRLGEGDGWAYVGQMWRWTDVRMPGYAEEPGLKMKTRTEGLSSVCSDVE